jgi:hypothetical protein
MATPPNIYSARTVKGKKVSARKSFDFPLAGPQNGRSGLVSNS